MIRILVATCSSIAIASGVVGSAQTPQPRNPPPAASAADVGRTLTVSGCIKTWDGRPGSIPTATPSEAAPNQYVLTNAVEATPEPRPANPGTPGTPSATAPKPPDMAHSTYLLKAQDEAVSFAAHVNHRVEVTGTLVETSASPAEKPASIPPSTPPSSAASRGEDHVRAQMKMRALTVSALKMVTTTCP